MYLAIVLLYAGLTVIDCATFTQMYTNFRACGAYNILLYYNIYIIIVMRATLILLCSIPAIVWSHDQSEEEGDQWMWAGGCFKENKLIKRRTRENNYYCNYDDLCTFVL